MALLTPDRYFSRITAIDIEADLLGRGYRECRDRKSVV